VSHPYFEIPTPIVIGHRGCAGEAPENTLPSFERALAQGAAILESDVHVTRDGVPVLIHDDDVDRNTDAAGPVAELDLAALSRLDAGHRFTPDTGASFPFRGRGIRIPTLAEALSAFPGARFNLELKLDRPGLIENTLAVIRDAARESLTLVTAGDDALMTRLRARIGATGAGVAQGASTADVLGFIQAARDGAAPPPGPMALQIPAEFGGRPLVTPALVDYAHRHAVQVHVWTVNDPEEMTRLLALGVDGLISDFPARVRRVIDGRGATPPG
jgi:glycerophosphoryl diester phosphodiesterase